MSEITVLNDDNRTKCMLHAWFVWHGLLCNFLLPIYVVTLYSQSFAIFLAWSQVGHWSADQLFPSLDLSSYNHSRYPIAEGDHRPERNDNTVDYIKYHYIFSYKRNFSFYLSYTEYVWGHYDVFQLLCKMYFYFYFRLSIYVLCICEV